MSNSNSKSNTTPPCQPSVEQDRVVVVPNMFVHRHRALLGDARMQADPVFGIGLMGHHHGSFLNRAREVTYVSGSYAVWMMAMKQSSSSIESGLPNFASPAKPKPFVYPPPNQSEHATSTSSSPSSSSFNPSSTSTTTNSTNTITTTTMSTIPPHPIDTNVKKGDGPLTSPLFGKNEYVSIIVFGASGDLAKKKTYPALFSLFKHQFLPETTNILGYARSDVQLADFQARIKPNLKDKDDALIQRFLGKCHYLHGSYDQDQHYQGLKMAIASLESRFALPGQSLNRVFYMALPPSVFIPVANQLHAHCKAPEGGWTRVIVEKPFGKDLESSRELGRALAAKWHEHELYRIDHYLGKEMVKNLISLRFANMFFGAVWDRNAISNVQITFKEMIGTEGRGGYFDEFGIVRDVMQNHLLQILTLVAMDRPVTLQADDVRNEKVKVLRCMQPIKLEDMVLGQYVPSEDGTKPGYLDDKTVPKGSKTPTYAAAVMYINNDRWAGVPFILRCGKALNEAKTEVRIQFRDVPGGAMFPSTLSRNELVIRVQPKEAVYLKLMNKEPGLSYRQHIAELDMTYHERYEGVRIPDAYESLLLDVLRGDQANFVRDDELDAAWSLFTPVLHQIDAGEVDPVAYPYGSRGPNGLIKFMAQYGVERDRSEYNWTPRTPKM